MGTLLRILLENVKFAIEGALLTCYPRILSDVCLAALYLPVSSWLRMVWGRVNYRTCLIPVRCFVDEANLKNRHFVCVGHLSTTFAKCKY